MCESDEQLWHEPSLLHVQHCGESCGLWTFSHVSASCHTRGLPVKVKSSSISSLCIVKLHPSVSEDDDSRWWSFQSSVFGHKIPDMTHNDGQQHHCSISGAGYSSCVYFKGRNEQQHENKLHVCTSREDAASSDAQISSCIWALLAEPVAELSI